MGLCCVVSCADELFLETRLTGEMGQAKEREIGLTLMVYIEYHRVCGKDSSTELIAIVSGRMV